MINTVNKHISTVSEMTNLNGLTTHQVDVTNLQYQADINFQPNKGSLWMHPPEKDGWILAHNAIRFELSSMRKALIKLGDTKLVLWQVNSIKEWWDGHNTHIHEHHTNEDKIFNPFIRTRVVYPDKLEADHIDIVQLMDEINVSIAALTTGSTTTQLLRLWERYEKMMLSHLYEEEMVGLPLLRAYFTPSEVAKCTNQFVKNGDPRALGAFVHCMGSKELVFEFMKSNGIPFFVWYIPGTGFKALRTIYRKKMVMHIDSILAGKVVSSLNKPRKSNACLTCILC